MKKVSGLIAIIFSTLFLFWPLTKYFFFQDDFILLDIAQSTKTLADAFRFSNFIFWRPLSVQGYFKIALYLFGLNPFYYHLVSLSFLIVEALLVWRIVSQITKKPVIGWLTGFLFSTSSTHFMSQMWIGEFPTILGFFFFLLATLAGIVWINDPSGKKIVFVSILYTAGLLSHELVILFPVFIFILAMYRKKRIMLSSFFILIAPGIVYLMLRMFLFPIPAHGVYKMKFDLDAVKAIWWYFLWLLNLPEELKFQSFFPLIFRKEFRVNFFWQSLWWTLQPILLIVLGLIVPLVTKARKGINKFSFTIAGVWIVVGGAPLLLALGHQYPFLLLFSMPGWAFCMAISLAAFVDSFNNKVGNIYLGVFLSIWVFSSLYSLNFTELTHWTVQEARRAEAIIHIAQRDYGSFPPHSTVVIPLDKGHQNETSLADQFGLRIMFGELTLTTYFGQLQDIVPVECMYLLEPGLNDCLKRHLIFRVKV